MTRLPLESPAGAREAELQARLAALDLEQKVRLCTGADVWALYEEPAVGLRRLVTSDGPAGVRGERWDEREPSANVPSPTALAATWDEARIERLGALLAGEARRKGVDVLLAPTVNLHRSPYGGRHFECFSEDPLLTGRIGIAYVRGLQGAGVGATVKHFVANDSETERFTMDVRVGERALRELYLAPFETIAQHAHPWAVMIAYNRVNGHSMTESPLLRDVLKDEWEWDGVAMSDWFATRSTVAAGNAALDVAMPGPAGPWGDALVVAVRDGHVSEEAVDDKVLRILRLAARVGALDGVAPGVERPPDTPLEAVGPELRSLAAASFVLVRNEGAFLPLDGRMLRRVAVIGPNAAVARTLGGGSATVFPPYTVSPLEGVRASLPHAEVVHIPGVRSHLRIPVAAVGAQVEFRAGDGRLLGVERRRAGSWRWQGTLGGGVAFDQVASIVVRAKLRAETAGRHEIGCSGTGRFTLEAGGATVLDTTLAVAPGADPAEALLYPPQEGVPVTLEAGEAVDVVLTHELADAERAHLMVGFALNHQPPTGSERDELAKAVALARDADVVVVAVGTSDEVEREGFDRASLALPGRQDELVRAVAAANPRTVVLVNAGAPVLMPWADDVPSVLLTWFAGQETGNSIADVLLGHAEPAGRLPTTWPDSEEGLPSTRPLDGVLAYDEGIRVGYRGDPPVRYPFGHGLGYGEWEYEAIAAPAEWSSDEPRLIVRVQVRNAASRAAREVVQVYASRAAGAIERPVRWLVGFAGVEAGAGETAWVDVELSARAFAHWDSEAGGWAVEPGAFTLWAGRSSGDLRRSAGVVVDAGR